MMSAHASMSGPTARTSRWMLLAETAMPADSARFSEACRYDWLRAASWQRSFAAAGLGLDGDADEIKGRRLDLT